MVGTGKYGDPRRPMYAPNPGAPHPVLAAGAKPAPAITGFSYQLSDDGNYALVEFVARDKAAFAAIYSEASRAGLRYFERGKATRAEIETEFRKYRKDFDLTKLGAGAQ